MSLSGKSGWSGRKGFYLRLGSELQSKVRELAAIDCKAPSTWLTDLVKRELEERERKFILLERR